MAESPSDRSPAPPEPPSSSARVGELVSHKFFAPLVRFFRRRGFASAEAEDGAQEVFVRLSGLEADHRVDNPMAYLFRVAASVVTDRARRAKVRHEAHHVSADDIELGDEAPSTERVLIGREDLSLVMQALEQMPARRREMLLLNRLDGLTYSQLAVRFGVSVSMIEKQMMRAIEQMHSCLGSPRRPR